MLGPQCGEAVVFFTAGFAGCAGVSEPPEVPELAEEPPTALLITSEVLVEGVDEVVDSAPTYFVLTTAAGGTYQLLSPINSR